ncbi:MAG: hypothetical protein ABIG63_09830 [Chloroflexota bacterium]
METGDWRLEIGDWRLEIDIRGRIIPRGRVFENRPVLIDLELD